LRFLLREELRPFELPRLLSRGAFVDESLSTRLDSVLAPDRLWLDRERPFDPEDRLFDFDPEDRLFDFGEDLREPPEPFLLPVDREVRCAI
jgi:hypothetical protein